MGVDLADLELGYFTRYQRSQGEADALREIARLLSWYNSGKISLLSLQTKIASCYSMALAQQADGALAVYSDFLHQLDERGR